MELTTNLLFPIFVTSEIPIDGTKDFNGSKNITAYFHVDFDRPETTGGETNRLLSEDYFFCQMSRKAGTKIWACPWMQLSHVGTYVYRGSVQALAAMEQVQSRTQSMKIPTAEELQIDIKE